MLPGWTITVSSPLLVEPLQRATNDLGKANFTRLAPGSYTACIGLQNGWVNTQPASTPPCHSVTLPPGARTRVYFGNQQGDLRVTAVGSPPLDEIFTLVVENVDDEAEEEEASAWFQLDLTSPDTYTTDVGATKSAGEMKEKVYLPVIEP
jgi:hypothetical protein